MNLTEARNPKYKNAEETLIDIEVKFQELGDQWLPFTANPDDTVAHGVDIYNRAVAGEFGEIESFVE